MSSARAKAEVAKSRLTTKRQDKQIPDDAWLSSGSTLVNLACSGKMNCCYSKGGYFWYVGDSASGKSWFIMTAFAEANLNKGFDKYRFILDQPERGAKMDWARFFGESAAARIEPPALRDYRPAYSVYVEEFHARAQEAFAAGPCIYGLDSMDALRSAADEDKGQEVKAAILGKGKKKFGDIAGSYGGNKPKANSSGIRESYAGLDKHGSILFLVSQTRDNIGFGAQFNPKTYSGGHALKFWADLQIWTSIAGHIKKTVNGKPREQGIYAKIQIKKNRITGRDRTVEVPIYHSSGLDDIGSCVDYLVLERYWQQDSKTGVTVAPEFGIELRPEALIKHIEAEGLEYELRKLTEKVWNDIEAQCAVERKPRYK